MGTEGNEEADNAAKSAVNKEMLIKLSILEADMKNHMNNKIQSKQFLYWNGVTNNHLKVIKKHFLLENTYKQEGENCVTRLTLGYFINA